MGNLRERFKLVMQIALCSLLNILPAIVVARKWTRKWILPILLTVWTWFSRNWKFLTICGGLYAAVKYARLPTDLPAIPHLQAVPLSAVFFVLAVTLLVLSLCAFGYVVFTFLALALKINQTISADVRGVSAFVNKIQEGNKPTTNAEGNVYAYDEVIQAGIEEQQRLKREKRLSQEEFENFVKVHAGDLDADMSGSGLP